MGVDRFEEIEVAQAGNKELVNFTPLLKKVREFETQGYEFVENDYSSTQITTNYVLLRKPK